MAKVKYPFSPAWLDAAPEPIAELFRGLELTMLDEICSRLRAAGELNEVTVQAISALRAQGIDLDEIKKAIQDTAEISEKGLNKLLDDVVKRNQAFYTELIDLAKVTAPAVLVNADDIETIRKQALGEFRNITRSMGFLVNDGKTLLQPAKAYQWALDSASLQIQSGAISYNQAIANATQELANSGLRYVDYESGHRDQVDVAARRAVLSGINQLNQKYREASVDYLETDLVECTAHIGARDKGDVPENHKLWQGKVYRWSGKPKTSTGEYPDFEKVCGYGLGEGIGGWNCRHSFYPFVEGVMERTYTDQQLADIDPPPFEYQGKEYSAYDATQKQREIERSIRKWKRRKIAAKGTEEETAINVRLRRLNAEYRAFSKAAGLPTQQERMKVLYA